VAHLVVAAEARRQPDRRLTLMLNLADEAFTVAVNGEVLEASSPPAEPAVPPHAWAVLAG
jgi:Domain of unknown function (DUF3459)